MYPFITVSIFSSEEWTLTIPLSVLQGEDGNTGKKVKRGKDLFSKKKTKTKG